MEKTVKKRLMDFILCKHQLAKAFDTMSHSQLLYVLQVDNSGLSDKFFENYLTIQNNMLVRINGELCGKKVLSFGVPQGIIPRPILDYLYINDIHIFF